MTSQRGMTLIELCIVIVVLGTLMSLAVAGLLRARVAGNESSAIASLRSINSAQFVYQNSCGNGLYAPSLVVLGTKPSGIDHAFLEEDLGGEVTRNRSGYTFRVAAGAGSNAGPNDCLDSPTVSGFYATAVPIDPGDTGNTAYATNQIGGIWEAPGAVPPPEPFGPPSRPAQ